MINKSLILFTTILSLFGGEGGAQTAALTGSDICGDGRQSTTIGVTGMDPGKYYALYLDDNMVQVRRSAGEGKESSFIFGTFKETGIYTAVAFDKVVEGFPQKSGTAVKGKVSVSPVPSLIMGDTLRIKSGEALNYIPRADLKGTTFTWSAILKYGNASGYNKKGSDAIHETILVTGNGPACVVYSITPHGPNHIVSCMGDPRDLIVLIRP